MDDTVHIATAQQTRDLEQQAIAAGTSVRTLMERAAAAVFERLLDLIPRDTIGILCGKGNNGGDGFVVARLAAESGYRVECLVAAEEKAIVGVAQEALQALRARGVEPTFCNNPRWSEKLAHSRHLELIVDALLGTGAKGEIQGPIADAIHAANASDAFIVSIDIPSGIECDTGRELGASIHADATVTFGHAKPFLFQNEGLERTGAWSVADIGLGSDDGLEAFLLNARWVGRRMPRRTLDSNKGRNGHVLIVGGSQQYRGAVTLAAHAALRSGAGLVTVAAVEEVCAAVAAQLPEALLLPIGVDREGADKIIEYSDKVDAGLFGPGMGQNQATSELLSNVFRSWHRPALVDADALNAVSKGIPLPSCPCVLTPHPGEAARLLGKQVADVQRDRFESVRTLATTLQATTLLKGRYSLVCSGREVAVNDSGNPGLATGGSGDTLSGVVATLLAQGLDPFDAAAVGMFWHGVAADICAERIGTVGYTPTEVSMAIPAARDTILQKCEP